MPLVATLDDASRASVLPPAQGVVAWIAACAWLSVLTDVIPYMGVVTHTWMGAALHLVGSVALTLVALLWLIFRCMVAIECPTDRI